MGVYVDNAMLKYGRMKMSHLIADTLEELHAMAKAIGIQRKWFQANASFPHYDICKEKRALALSLGAQEVTSRELVAVMRRYRSNHCDGRRRCQQKANG